MSKARGVAQTSIGRRLVLILAGAVLTTRGKGKGKDKVTVEECRHPEDTAFNEPRNDGSGKGDRICGVCGWTICEVSMPADARDTIGTEDFGGSDFPLDAGLEADVAKAEEDVSVVSEDPAHREAFNEMLDSAEISTVDLYEQVQAGLAENGASLDETTGEVTQQPCVNHTCENYAVDGSGNGCNVLGWDEIRECKTFISGPLEDSGPVAAGAAGVVQEAKPDKVSSPFLRPLPVPVPEEDLAVYAKELGRLHTLWPKTKVDAKKFAKACKEVTDKVEEDMTAIAEIIEAGTEEIQVSCRWEFDYRSGEKRLRRLDTMDVIDVTTMTKEECHLSFDFDAEAAPVQEAPAGESAEVADEGAVAVEPEEFGEWVRNDERTLAILGLAGVKVDLEVLEQQPDEEIRRAEDWALAVHVQASDNDDVAVPPTPPFLLALEIGVDLAAGPDITVEAVVTVEGGEVVSVEPVLDAGHRCCLPTDRTTVAVEDVEVTYCTVCGLVSRKRGVNADPWDDDLDFAIGEKVDPLPAQVQ